jgi:membrane protein
MSRNEFWQVLKATYNEFNKSDVPYRAASLTYYVFFSLFPLLLLGIIVLGLFLDPQAAREFVFVQVAQLAPGAVEWLETLLGGVLEQREGVGWIAIVGLVTLAFSASGAFDALDKSINHAWGTEGVPNILVAKLTSFIMMAVLAALLLFSFLVSAFLQTIQGLSRRYFGDLPFDALVFQLVNVAASLAVTALIFLLIFKFVPRRHVKLVDVRPAALITAMIWTLAKEIFALYLGSSFSNFSAVYGTLGVVIALLLWIYVSSVIVLAGAEFSAETARYREARRRAEQQGAKSDLRSSPWLPG